MSQVSTETIIQAIGAAQKVGTPTSVTVEGLDSSANVTRCKGTTVPTDADAGFAKGCTFVKTNGAVATTVYINEGSETSADFNAIESSASTITGVTAGNGLTGGGTEGTVTLNVANTDGNITVGADSIDFANTINVVANITFTKEVNHTVTVSTTTTAATAGGNLSLAAAQGATTGAGGTISITGGASGIGATGNGGTASVTGGTAVSTNGNGADVILTGGTLAGTGFAGNVVARSLFFQTQGAQAAKTTSTTLTAAELKTGIITVNQGGGATSSLTLPTAADLDTALPAAATNDSFEFSLINISTVAAEDADILTNTGWTLVGDVAVQSNDAITSKSAGLFRARKTGAAAWTLYRLS